MFKYVIVVLALIATVLAGPKPQFFYQSAPVASTAYAYHSNYVKPAAATVYTAGYVPTAYSSSAYIAPTAYSAASYPTYAYL
ncbi:hypothetical protein RP20_CCG021908 [Aedes albopictus]|nr:hypothetical protein RP20_CCG021908 [Aedes albopictus]